MKHRRRTLFFALAWPLVLACAAPPAAMPPAGSPTAALSRVTPSSATAAGASPAAGGSVVPLLVLAASDLQFALPEVAARFEATTSHGVTVTLGSTGNLTAQIENGAPADAFFAADASFLERLDRKGLLLEETRRPYATGRIVVATAPGAPVVATIEDLARPAYKKVAIANPEHAPYGRAARQALQATGLWDTVQPKLVLGENVAQAFQFVQTGNAEAGIVALSVALGVPGTASVLVDESLHARLNQEVAVLKASRQPDVARQFIAFVNGPQGRPIMQTYGFALPGA